MNLFMKIFIIKNEFIYENFYHKNWIKKLKYYIIITIQIIFEIDLWNIELKKNQMLNSLVKLV